jgi:hypothetical protein
MRGAMTLSITTFSIIMLCHYAEYHILFVILLNVIILSVVMLNVVILRCHYAKCHGAMIGGVGKVTFAVTNCGPKKVWLEQKRNFRKFKLL